MRRSPFIAAAVAAIGLLILTFVFVLPQGAKVESAQAELVAADSELSALESDLSTLEALSASGDLAEQLAAARIQIPTTVDLEALLADLEEAATKSGVALNSITPGAPTVSSAGSLSALSLNLSATGSYFNLAEFVFELEHLDRLTRIDSISVAGSGAELSLQVGAFVYTTDLDAGPGSDPAPGLEVGA